MQVAAIPLSQRQYYRPSETVDFEISPGVGMAIVPGSIRIAGQAIFTDDTTTNPPVSYTNTVANFIDPQIGAHAFFRQFVVQTDKQGVIQNLQDYHRAMADMRSGMKTANMVMNNDSMALASGNLNLSKNIVGAGAAVSFVIDPEIAINRSQLVAIPYTKTGNIRLNIILNQGRNQIWGGSASQGVVLQNLELHYEVVASTDDGTAPIKLMSLATVKQVASSSLAAFSIISPQPSYALSVNFIATVNENANNQNSNALGNLPGISRVEYTFADSNDSIIQYPLENDKEIYRFWLKSYNSMRGLTDGAGSSMGVAYDQVLANTKFNIVIQSALATPTSCYFVFKGVVSI